MAEQHASARQRPASRTAGTAAERFRALPVLREERPDGSIVLRSGEPLAPYPDCFHDLLFRWAREAPGRTFLAERTPGRDGWSTISYGEAGEKVLRIAAALAERGLGPERPLIILSGNAIEHALLAFAGMVAGVPCAAVSVAYSLVSQDHGKLKHILELLDPGLVYAADAGMFAREALALPEMAGREIVIGTPAASAPGATPFRALLEGGSRDALAAARKSVGPDTIAKFLFTSGSTGVPKGVITTHRMLCSNQQMAKQLWDYMDRRPPVLVDWLPWSHVFGGNHNLGHVLYGGGAMYIDDGRPLPADVGRTIRNLEEVSPTSYFNVPRGYDFLVPELQRNEALRRKFFAELEVVFYAAATLPEHLWNGLTRLAETSGPQPATMLSGWGLTETAPTVTILNRHGGEPGNIGVPLPGVELKLVPNGPKREARVRGPNVTPGYWRMPEITQKAFDPEGYFITGDALVFVDDKDASRGVRFNGRVAEDFKLSSGTWVHTGGVRARALAALGPLISDVVVTAPDRVDLGLLIFASPAAVRDESYPARLTAALREMNRGCVGSSETVVRAMVMREPPSLDRGEVTDKGSLNMRAILEHRAGLVERLYDDPGNDADPEVLRP